MGIYPAMGQFFNSGGCADMVGMGMGKKDGGNIPGPSVVLLDVSEDHFFASLNAGVNQGDAVSKDDQYIYKLGEFRFFRSQLFLILRHETDR